MDPQAPVIIIKRKRVVAGGGHHGGAWKVAYADFVTAMMAFFLLMWLLNATTEEQRKGLADYFNPSIPVSRISGGGSDALNGSSLMSEDTMVSDGAGASATFKAPARAAADAAMESEPQSLENIAAEIEDAREKLDRPDLSQHIQTRMTPEGLLVELVDRQGTPLFAVGSAQPSPLLAELVHVIAPVLAEAENPIQIIGHTDSLQYGENARYSNWELSADRANVARRLLLKEGLDTAKVRGVVGRADADPLSSDPSASQNRRIAVLLMRQMAAPSPL